MSAITPSAHQEACALRKYGEKLGERLARLKEAVDMLRAQEGGAA